MSRKIVKSCDLDIDCWSKNHSIFLKMYMYIIYKIRHWVAVIYECVFIDFIRILRLLSRVFMMNFPAFLSRIFGFLGQFYMLGTFFQVYKLQFFEKSSISWKEFPPPPSLATCRDSSFHAFLTVFALVKHKMKTLKYNWINKCIASSLVQFEEHQHLSE